MIFFSTDSISNSTSSLNSLYAIFFIFFDMTRSGGINNPLSVHQQVPKHNLGYNAELTPS